MIKTNWALFAWAVPQVQKSVNWVLKKYICRGQHDKQASLQRDFCVELDKDASQNVKFENFWKRMSKKQTAKTPGNIYWTEKMGFEKNIRNTEINQIVR